MTLESYELAQERRGLFSPMPYETAHAATTWREGLQNMNGLLGPRMIIWLRTELQ